MCLCRQLIEEQGQVKVKVLLRFILIIALLYHTCGDDSHKGSFASDELARIDRAFSFAEIVRNKLA